MLSIISIILSSISIFLMIIVLYKISIKGIIKKIQNKTEQIILRMDQNTKRDINLLNEYSKGVHTLIKESELKMESFKEATQRLRDMIAESEKITTKSSKSFIYADNYSENSGLANIKPVGYKEQKKHTYIDPEATFEPTKTNFSTKQNIKSQSQEMQGSLFDENTASQQEESLPQQKTVLKDETILTSEGAAYKEVPLIITKVYDEKPKNFVSKTSETAQVNEKVEKLFHQGMQAEDIAAELSCSISEVQLIIDLL